MTSHMFTPQIVIVSKKTWDELSPASRKILRDSAVEATAFQRKIARRSLLRSVLDVRDHTPRNEPQRPYTGKRRARGRDDGPAAR